MGGQCAGGTGSSKDIELLVNSRKSARGDLLKLEKYEFKGDHSHEGFRLARAGLLCELSCLAYADGGFWSSKKAGQGNFAEGLKGTSMVFQYYCGGLPQLGLFKGPNEWGLTALSPDSNKKWDEGKGTMQSGLINYRGSCFTGDTQALISLREPKKQVIITFRGTEFTSIMDIITDMGAMKTTRTGAPEGSGKVHWAINNAWSSVKDTVIETVKKILDGKTYTSVLCTGHSLGGGLATLCAIALVEEIPGVNVEVYTYGGAVVGDQTFVKYFDSKVKVLWRVVNDQDIIPSVGLGLMGYVHAGKLVVINSGGIFIAPDGEIQDDAEGNMLEPLSDHMVSMYIKLLHLFDVIVNCKTNAKLKSTDTMAVMKEAWNVYQAPVQRKVFSMDDKEDTEFSVRQILSPNVKAMTRILEKKLKVKVVDNQTLESEMHRLCALYKKTVIDWSIFTIAVYNLHLAVNQGWRKWCTTLATWHQDFTLFEAEGNGFLSKEEFFLLMQDQFFVDKSEQEAQAGLKDIEAQFKKLDVNLDDQLSFREYALWRWIVEHHSTVETSFKTKFIKHQGRSEFFVYDMS